MQIVYADAMTLFKHSAVTDMHYDHETVSGWFDYVCDEKTPCITTARFDGAQRVCLKRCYPGRHQVYIPPDPHPVWVSITYLLLSKAV